MAEPERVQGTRIVVAPRHIRQRAVQAARSRTPPERPPLERRTECCRAPSRQRSAKHHAAGPPSPRPSRCSRSCCPICAPTNGAWPAPPRPCSSQPASCSGSDRDLRHLIDSGFGGHNPASLNIAALIMFTVVAALGAATSVRFYLISWLGERAAADLRRDLFNHVIGLEPSFFETALRPATS